MTREIKFRAKKINNNEFVIGYYLPMAEGYRHFIYLPLEYLNEHSRYEIDPKTLGQYTGLNDKNGKEIYEGDIISCQLFCPESNNCWITNSPIVVEWEEYGYDPFIEYGAPDHSFLVEIIGDIYQNPELLNEEKND